MIVVLPGLFSYLFFIGENIRLLFDIIEMTEEQNIPGLIFFSDFEKAFNSLDHTYMFKCLNTLILEIV